VDSVNLCDLESAFAARYEKYPSVVSLFDGLNTHGSIDERGKFDRELLRFMTSPEDYEGPSVFLENVAKPLYVAHALTKSGMYDAALDRLGSDGSLMCDWNEAAARWIHRKQNAAYEKGKI